MNPVHPSSEQAASGPHPFYQVASKGRSNQGTPKRKKAVRCLM